MLVYDENKWFYRDKDVPKEAYICYFYCIAYVIILFLALSYSLGADLIYKSQIVIAYEIAFAITLLVCPRFVICFNSFFVRAEKAFCNAYFPDFLNKLLTKYKLLEIISYYVLALLIIISFQTHYCCVIAINSRYAKEQPIARYVLVEETGNNFCVVSDWKHPGDTIKLYDKNCVKIANVAEVIRLKTKTGLLGLEYLYETEKSLEGFRKRNFPPDTKFPLSEEEFARLNITIRPIIGNK